MSQKSCGLSLDAISELFQAEGYQAKSHVEADRAIIDSAALGMKFRLFLYDPECADSVKYYRNFMFDAGYRLSLSSNIDQLAVQCASFNCKYRFLKALVSSNENGGIVAVQFDDTFADGDVESFNKAFQFFLRGLDLFQRDIINTAAYLGDESSKIHNEAIQAASSPVPDFDKAIALYRSAADLGFAGSLNNLGDFYERGEVVPPSDTFAIYWYTRAAERGEPTAYLSLATILARTAKDNSMLIEALRFANLAADYLGNGTNKRAALAIRRNLESLLDDGEITKAEKLVTDWHPLYQERRLLGDSVRSEGDRMIEGCLVN